MVETQQNLVPDFVRFKKVTLVVAYLTSCNIATLIGTAEGLVPRLVR